MLTAEALETIVRDWLKYWQHEGSPPLTENSTQQIDAPMLGQAHPDHPLTESPLQNQQKDAQNEDVQLEPSRKKCKANKEANNSHMDEEEVADLEEALQKAM